ncbi:MAG: hypothetical protein UY16_C0065G0003 [Candidatus Gottesmanbacteria bacterium GW2011_GWA2_47_9]|uniref:Uncharacterized protein n=1 Tax=Candidatus Gottesmanbacteria bacterium GW2011_GWA2_47_9 TaxID=1618445 RepID=A0A0G1WUT9_9BACT|nr:MAG: hypothetical protein UY16_C0065G0003 [Candidatus Gottesmanbacteria bacterium GW2011_GWA2_47_9]
MPAKEEPNDLQRLESAMFPDGFIEKLRAYTADRDRLYQELVAAGMDSHQPIPEDLQQELLAKHGLLNSL